LWYFCFMPNIIAERLPQVIDTDPDVNSKLTAVVADFLEFRVPGFGITHDWEMANDKRFVIQHLGTHDHLGVNKLHRKMVKGALDELEPPVITDDHWDSSGWSGYIDTSLHDDYRGRFQIPGQEVPELRMWLRLHTTGADLGAIVLLAHSNLGVDNQWGDSDLFEDDYEQKPTQKAMDEFGYDGQPLMWGKEMLERVENGLISPLAVTCNMFAYIQPPLSSVVFRTESEIGPSTAHAFFSLEENKPRAVLTSNLIIKATTL
jgi:hypothetical protein